ncbi:hypothetical protein M409DRAFT_68365 [Zasmidium cellare ATCC 36951]|uniref:Carboxylic ester hydrolase n=1 Tax=Zasmidium cellare ATCC 36951 TaxID=1080233 RepID=A0A6A6CC79_ZASCE|nr:uncharacterized protein M409DRAFT_68365 [Zasmidium cellare ATCC 36951]KAF2163820.1 hypothetical protein M409DRAFT_68365 [Zasmidium cellare ATCC 36951]
MPRVTSTPSPSAKSTAQQHQANYEDRFLAVGNGGMAGYIDYIGMLAQLNSGLGVAVVGGNAGHSAIENNVGVGAPGVYLPYLHDRDQVEAWIHNAISLLAPAAKAWTQAYYGRRLRKSYYYGCSTGGAQGFALAKFYPGLFDGVYAGSPGNWYSHLALSFLWNAQHTSTTETKLTQAELNLTTNAVLDACDEIDGVKDRVIENPLRCPFDIDSLACKSSSQPSSNPPTCLTPSKIASAKAIYAGPKRSDTHQPLYAPFALGSEIQWSLQEGPLASAFSVPILQNLVFNSLDYNTSTFNWASDVDAVTARTGALIDENSPNLSTYRNRGGKLLVTQGWADPYNAAEVPIQHLQSIQSFFHGDVGDWYRLFMIPGGGHCGAASYYPQVPAEYHILTKLIGWVERGEVPESVLSCAPPDGSARTRKLCAWPATAMLVGGDAEVAGSYVCR